MGTKQKQEVRNVSQMPTNYEKYFSTPEKVADSLFGAKQWESECADWIDNTGDGALTASINNLQTTVTTWLHKEAEA